MSGAPPWSLLRESERLFRTGRWLGRRLGLASPDHDLLLRDAFRFDEERGVPVLEVAIRRYEDVFNGLDRAPFVRRDISADLRQFLDDCSLWVPLPRPFAVEFQVLEDGPDPERQAAVVAGLRNYFAYLSQMSRLEARFQRRRVAIYVLLSLCILSVMAIAGRVLDPGQVHHALVLQGMNVGGWVFLWEALSIAFIRSHDAAIQRQRLERLVGLDVRFGFPTQGRGA